MARNFCELIFAIFPAIRKITANKHFSRQNLLQSKHRSFHCHATKKLTGNRSGDEAKQMKCYKRLISKQFVQVWGSVAHSSELFAETCHAPLYSFVWRRHIGAPFWCTNMAAGSQLAYVRIIISSNT